MSAAGPKRGRRLIGHAGDGNRRVPRRARAQEGHSWGRTGIRSAAAGQTYGFRLTVKDDQGAQGIARANVTSRAPLAARILRFQANPQTVRAGSPVQLLWLIENAG